MCVLRRDRESCACVRAHIDREFSVCVCVQRESERDVLCAQKQGAVCVCAGRQTGVCVCPESELLYRAVCVQQKKSVCRELEIPVRIHTATVVCVRADRERAACVWANASSQSAK